jgi:hypothetical protein
MKPSPTLLKETATAPPPPLKTEELRTEADDKNVNFPLVCYFLHPLFHLAHNICVCAGTFRATS